jgi:hypothetical protein
MLRFVAALLLVSATAAFGQQPAARSDEPQAAEKVGKQIQAFPVGERPPRIDGKLDDEVWTRAQAIDDMVQNDPDNMAAPTERTVVQVAYDDRSIYVAAHCYMTDPSKITTALGRRDTNPRSDSIKMTFDPRHDHLTAYTFDANPSGVQGDMTWFDDTRSSTDYDAVWEVRTEITSDGWVAEFRIPFSQMRFSVTPGQEVVWGFNVRRDIVGRAEVDRWVATPRGVNGFVSRFGHLVFQQPPAPPRRLEVQPFLLARQEHETAVGSDQDYSGGLDFRMGIGTSATLSAAVNPDFGQVEQDPAVLNLSVFETFFPEKRPFFIEDSRTLVPPYPQVVLFHSRRIGKRPGRIELPEGDTLIEQPDQTTILGATKVTGKASGWTFGGLTALTDREYAKVEFDQVDASGALHRATTERLIEPLTSYNVGRVQRDILKGSSNIGAIGTAVMREKDLDAFTGGIDYTIRWDKNRNNWNGHWIGTRAPVDGVMKSGFGGVTNYNFSTKYVGVFAHYDFFDADFKNSDLGFFASRPDKTSANLGMNFNQPDPRKYYRSINTFFNVNRQWNGDWLELDKSWNFGGNVEFLNFWDIFAGAGKSPQVFDDLDTRGGPPIVRPASQFFNMSFSSDSRRRWQFGSYFFASNTEAGGHSKTIDFFLQFQPVPALQTSLSGNYNFGRDAAQWIENTDVTGDGEDDNIYGTLDRDVVSLTARTTYAFTRDMTLEVYLQPFVAVGDYTDIRRLAQPMSFLFESAEVDDNPDFNTKSFRSNVVFRWEYKRGSTVYVVWNVSNEDESRPGEFSGFRDLRRGFSGPGSQVFMVKLNYWLGL